MFPSSPTSRATPLPTYAPRTNYDAQSIISWSADVPAPAYQSVDHAWSEHSLGTSLPAEPPDFGYDHAASYPGPSLSSVPSASSPMRDGNYPPSVSRSFVSNRGFVVQGSSNGRGSAVSTQRSGPTQGTVVPALAEGYYCLYTDYGPLISKQPCSDAERWKSRYYEEHVPPPKLQQNYNAFIAQREQIHPSRLSFYVAIHGRGPGISYFAFPNDPNSRPFNEAGHGPLFVRVQMLPNEVRADLANALPPLKGLLSSRPLVEGISPVSIDGWSINTNAKFFASRPLILSAGIGYYRIYTGHGPLDSTCPETPQDPSLSSFYLAHICPPAGEQQYIAFVSQRERIHISRISLHRPKGNTAPSLQQDRITRIDPLRVSVKTSHSERREDLDKPMSKFPLFSRLRHGFGGRQKAVTVVGNVQVLQTYDLQDRGQRR